MNKVVSAVTYQGGIVLVFTEDGTIYQLVRTDTGCGWKLQKEVIRIPTS